MRNKLIIAGTVALLLLLGFGGWMIISGNKAPASDSTEQTTTRQETDTTQETSLPQTEDTTTRTTITYRDNGFEKSTYEVKAGTQVMVVNDSTRTLEFASADHPTHKENPELNLDPLRPGETTLFTATRTGTWGIHDHNEEDLITTIIVSE